MVLVLDSEGLSLLLTVSVLRVSRSLPQRLVLRVYRSHPQRLVLIVAVQCQRIVAVRCQRRVLRVKWGYSDAYALPLLETGLLGLRWCGLELMLQA